MIDLGTTELFIPGPTLPREVFETYSTRLFDDWEARVQRELSVPEYSLNLAVEEGSVALVATVGATLYAIYQGIGDYESFISGLGLITKQVRSAGDFLVRQATEPFPRLDLKPRVRRHLGPLERLRRLMYRVQRKEISVEDALKEAEDIVGDDAADSPAFMDRLAAALTSVGTYPPQLLLPMELPEEAQEQPEMTAGGGNRSRAPTPDGPEPKSPRLRVEVWRETRTGKREVRITEL